MDFEPDGGLTDEQLFTMTQQMRLDNAQADARYYRSLYHIFRKLMFVLVGIDVFLALTLLIGC